MKNITRLLTTLILSIGLLFGFVYLKENKTYMGYIRQNNIIINESSLKYDKDFRVNKLRKNNNSYYFEKLSNEEKELYIKLANTIKDFDNSFVVEKENFKEKDFQESLGKVVNYFLNDHPEVFYLNSEYKYNEYESLFRHEYIVTISYLYKDKNEIINEIEELDKKMNDILEKIKYTDEYEIELAIHDYIIQNAVYDYNKKDENIHNIYGALITKKAVCDGFSKALNILLERKNIDSLMVIGSLENQPHAWSLVKLDENYYHTDITSDISVNKADNIIIHTYLNRTTEDIKKTHKIAEEEILPKSELDNKNYYIKNNLVIDSDKNVSSQLKKIASQSRNKDIIEFQVKDMENIKSKLVEVLGNIPQFRQKRQINYYQIFDTIILKNT